MNKRIRAFDPNTGSYGHTISDDDTRYLDDDGSAIGSGSFRNGGPPGAQGDDVPKRELPRPARRPIPSIYDAFRARDDTLDLTETELLALIAARAQEHAAADPARAAALNRVAAKIEANRADWDKLSHIDQVDAWSALMDHELSPPRRRDGAIDPADMEAQSLAAAGRGALDLSAHPEMRLSGRDVRAEWEAEQEAEKNRRRGNQ